MKWYLEFGFEVFDHDTGHDTANATAVKAEDAFLAPRLPLRFTGRICWILPLNLHHSVSVEKWSTPATFTKSWYTQFKEIRVVYSTPALAFADVHSWVLLNDRVCMCACVQQSRRSNCALLTQPLIPAPASIKHLPRCTVSQNHQNLPITAISKALSVSWFNRTSTLHIFSSNSSTSSTWFDCNFSSTTKDRMFITLKKSHLILPSNPAHELETAVPENTGQSMHKFVQQDPFFILPSCSKDTPSSSLLDEDG